MTHIVFEPKQQNMPSVRPKDAATLIIVRRDRDGIRVLMGQRHAQSSAFGSKFVFPGGRLDPCDLRIAAGGELRPEVAAKIEPGIGPKRARGLALAAIRETFEETGVLIGEQSQGLPRTRAPAWRRYFAHAVVPRLDRFDLVARAITPPGRAARRFDARFFMTEADAIAGEVELAEREELLTPTWLTLAEARALDLMSITRIVLDEVEARVAEGPGRPVPFFRVLHGKRHMSHL